LSALCSLLCFVCSFWSASYNALSHIARIAL
jgi:hypothetical protein